MMQWLLEHWKLLALLINSAFVIAVWGLSKTYAKKEDVDALNNRISHLEQEVQDLPSIKDVHKIESEVAAMRAHISGMEKLLSRMSNQLDMLVENELKGN